MSLKIIGQTKDYRTNTDVLYAEIDAKDYITLVGEDFDKFEIQRKRVDPKKYTRLKEDFKKGALLPTITLAVEFNSIDKYTGLINDKNYIKIEEQLKGNETLYILDGLQRTYIISDIKAEGEEIHNNQKLLLEIWFEPNIDHLIYRLIVLNSGQKPMSMRHQVELLFMTLRKNLCEDIGDLELIREKDSMNRTKAKKFAFDRVVNAYYCFLTKSPEIDRDNLVVKKMNEDDILSSTETELNENYQSFRHYLSLYSKLDFEFFRIYQNHENLSSFKNWLAEENTMRSFFAAIAKFNIDKKRKERLDSSIDELLKTLEGSQQNIDIFEFETFKEIKSGIDSKKSNVGVALRKNVMDGFREFFINEGELSYIECLKTSVQ